MLQTRSGLSRIEALVLVAIVLVAIALLIPAILRVREAASTAICANNLHRIAVGAWDYHVDYNRLPSGSYGPVRSHDGNTTYSLERGPHSGVLVELLPYLSEESLYRSLKASKETWSDPQWNTRLPNSFAHGLHIEQQAWWTESTNLGPTTGQARIKLFTCPADDVYDEKIPAGIVRLHVANGSFSQTTLPEARTLGRTNYVGVAGAAGDFDDPKGEMAVWDQWCGYLYNRSSANLAFVLQHRKNTTLFFGESLGSSGIEPRDTAFTWFGCGAMGTAYGLGRSNLLSSPTPPPLGADPGENNRGASWYRFSSRHRNGVQFCCIDGTVRMIRFGKTTVPDLSNHGANNSDWAVLQQLAGCNSPFLGDTSILE